MPQVAASQPPESAFKPASRLAGSDGDLKGLGKEAAKKAVERSGSVWGVFGRVSSLLSTASSNKKKVRPCAPCNVVHTEPGHDPNTDR